MSRKMKLLAAVGGLGVLGMLGASARAASLEVALQEDGGAITVVASGPAFGTASFSGAFGDFSVTLLGGSSDNGATLSDLLSSTTSITNNGGIAHTLSVYVSEVDYTLPAGAALAVESSLGGTLNNGPMLAAVVYQAFADKNNNLRGMADFTNGPQVAVATGSSFDTGSAKGTFIRLPGNYSLTTEATFVLGAGAKVNYSDHENVTPAPLPATASMGLGLFGVIGAVGGLNAMRRRRAAAL